jgi:hypothetical protein
MSKSKLKCHERIPKMLQSYTVHELCKLLFVQWIEDQQPAGLQLKTEVPASKIVQPLPCKSNSRLRNTQKT